jgi:ABC-2 type transport system permease protein
VTIGRTPARPPGGASDVTGAFVYLTVCSLRNRVRVLRKRLREPRYVIGLVAGLLYMWAFVFRQAFTAPGGRRPDALFQKMAQGSVPVDTLVGTALFVLAALAWLWPGSRPALLFTRAEVQFLFQAPLSRRQLVRYKLLRSQVGTIFGSVITTVFLRPGAFVTGWTTMAGLWLIFSIIGLHTTGISLSRQSVAKAGLTGLARQWVPFALLGSSIVILVVTVAMDWGALAALATPREVLAELHRLATTGAAGLILWPFRALARVPLAPTTAAFWMALPWGLLILAVNYLWVLRADAAFEEASATRSEQVAQRLAAVRAGRLSAPKVRATSKASASTTPFALSLTGRPETAILWKNLIMIGRYMSLKTLWRIVPLLIVIGVMVSQSGRRGGLLPLLAMLCVMVVIFIVVLGPQIARNDLRQDLAQLAVLKTWPVTGAALVRGELLAPTVVLTALAWLFVIVSTLLAGGLRVSGDVAELVALNKVSYAAAAMLVAPGLILVQLVVQNGLAIVFPAWVAIGANRARGIEATGQRLLMMLGNILTLLLSLLPGVIVAGGLAVAVYWTTGVVLVVLPALVLGLFLVAESWLAVEALGRVLDRTDVSAIEAVE